MSIEKNIERIAVACEAMLAIMQTESPVNQVVQQAVAQSVPEQPATPQPAPVQQPVVTPEVAQPATPSPAADPNCPIVDGQSLTKYVMESYQAMGAEKGAQIQNIMASLGYGNINDVKPEHYASLYQQVEQLKNA